MESPEQDTPPLTAPDEPDIPAPAGAGPPLSDEDRVLVVFAYLGPLALLAFTVGRREYIQWHARQGLVFFVASFALILVTATVERLGRGIHWFFGLTTGLLAAVVYLCLAGVALVCILKALRGERWRLPLIRDLADRL